MAALRYAVRPSVVDKSNRAGRRNKLARPSVVYAGGGGTGEKPLRTPGNSAANRRTDCHIKISGGPPGERPLALRPAVTGRTSVGGCGGGVRGIPIGIIARERRGSYGGGGGGGGERLAEKHESIFARPSTVVSKSHVSSARDTIRS